MTGEEDSPDKEMEQGPASIEEVYEAFKTLGIDLEEDEGVEDGIVDDPDAVSMEGGVVVWEIRTGLSTPSGTAQKMRVTASDPQDDTLLAKFMEIASTEGPSASVKMLWDACVASPPKLSERYEKLPQVFKAGLTERLLRLVGFEDFFEKLAAHKAEVRRLVKESFTASRPSTARTQTPSLPGSRPNLRKPISMPSRGSG